MRLLPSLISYSCSSEGHVPILALIEPYQITGRLVIILNSSSGAERQAPRTRRIPHGFGVPSISGTLRTA